jgi:hypothetical protein
MIQVGQRVLFDAFSAMSNQGGIREHLYTKGTVVYVNERHKWFSIEYGKHKARDSYKFIFRLMPHVPLYLSLRIFTRRFHDRFVSFAIRSNNCLEFILCARSCVLHEFERQEKRFSASLYTR